MNFTALLVVLLTAMKYFQREICDSLSRFCVRGSLTVKRFSESMPFVSIKKIFRSVRIR